MQYRCDPDLLFSGLNIGEIMILAMHQRSPLSTVGVLLLSGIALFQGPAAAEPLAPGHHIAVADHRLHLDCRGGDGGETPTVVFEAGLGGSALEWYPARTLLVPRLRVCLYDRAGMGWSQTGPMPRSSGVIAAELHQLLTNAGETGPWVVVAHSFGGLVAQMLARQHPAAVVGLVLVDASHPAQVERFAAPPVNINVAPRGRLSFLMPVNVPTNLPSHLKTTAQALLSAQPARLTVVRELEGFRLSARELAMAPPLPDLPLVVLTRGVPQGGDDGRSRRREALWQILQRELAATSSLGVQIVARRSGHHVHLDQPDLVAAAVEALAAVDPNARGLDRAAAFHRQWQGLTTTVRDALVLPHGEAQTRLAGE